jgi:hypothetical protein
LATTHWGRFTGEMLLRVKSRIIVKQVSLEAYGDIVNTWDCGFGENNRAANFAW